MILAMIYADLVLLECSPNRCLYLWTEDRAGRPTPMYAWDSEKTAMDLAGMTRAQLRRAIGIRKRGPRVRQHP